MAGEVRFLRRTPVQHLSFLLGWVLCTQPNRIDKCCTVVLLKNLTSPAISNVQANRFWSNVPFGQTDFGQMSFLVKWILVKCPFWSNGFWSNVPFGKVSILVKKLFGQKTFWSNVLFGQKIFGQMSFLIKKFLVNCPFWSKYFWSNVLFGQKIFGQMSFWSKNFWSNDFWSNASLVK